MLMPSLSCCSDHCSGIPFYFGQLALNKCITNLVNSEHFEQWLSATVDFPPGPRTDLTWGLQPIKGCWVLHPKHDKSSKRPGGLDISIQIVILTFKIHLLELQKTWEAVKHSHQNRVIYFFPPPKKKRRKTWTWPWKITIFNTRFQIHLHSSGQIIICHNISPS